MLVVVEECVLSFSAQKEEFKTTSFIQQTSIFKLNRSDNVKFIVIINIDRYEHFVSIYNFGLYHSAL